MCCPIDLSDEINTQEDLSHEMCPHKPEFPFIRVPIKRGVLYYEITTRQTFIPYLFWLQNGI